MISKELALDWHLQYNHYPPITEFFDACLAAIDAINEGDYNRLIDLPEGVEHRKYGKVMPAGEIAEFAHLDGFLDDPEAEYEYGEV